MRLRRGKGISDQAKRYRRRPNNRELAMTSAHTPRMIISINLLGSAKPNDEDIPAAHDEVSSVVVLFL